ncbi:MAG: DUF4296 domain-containing protein [Flavobacteriales bacterium]
MIFRCFLNRFVLLSFVLLGMLSSCGNKGSKVPNDVIPPEQMSEIILEFSLVDGAQNVSFSAGNAQVFESDVFYRAVLHKHQITKDSLMQSIDWYAQNIKLLMTVYERSIQKLDSLRTSQSLDDQLNP